MAGDWMPMRLDLDEDPAVVGMAQILVISELTIVGCLWKLWSLASRQTANGWLPNYTPQKLDAVVGQPGFAAALEEMNWLQRRPGGLAIPKFETWLSHSAKKRIEAAAKKRAQRLSVPISEGQIEDKIGTETANLSSPLLSSSLLLGELGNGEKGGPKATGPPPCADGGQATSGNPRQLGPVNGQTWPDFLAGEWRFFYRGTSSNERDEGRLSGAFESMLDRGIPAREILDRIRSRPSGERTEFFWQFEKRWAKQSGQAPTTAELFAQARKELGIK